MHVRGLGTSASIKRVKSIRGTRESSKKKKNKQNVNIFETTEMEINVIQIMNFSKSNMYIHFDKTTSEQIGTKLPCDYSNIRPFKLQHSTSKSKSVSFVREISGNVLFFQLKAVASKLKPFFE